ncbi:DUF4326 domain-containing protein [Pseudomonas taiwanensis]|uniref:DUF4326 domain-containing protein n=1 Tax=Pseudomonas taiwanensis TaxID=470150 RepID=UPI0028E07EED|nr:DUF4326 domain-containing protein [Pseudomonas taiwanensis]MDT8924976.1 DUF4326 domain-containing protein [Pseudomonas taiwanensis]
MITKVSNIRANSNHTIFIGRSRDPYHFGNPFPIGGKNPLNENQVFDRAGCILAFHDWLAGKPGYEQIEQDRRRWILENLETLRGQTLGCFCAPKACHGDAYRVFLGEITYDDLLDIVQGKPKAQPAPAYEAPLQGSLL